MATTDPRPTQAQNRENSSSREGESRMVNLGKAGRDMDYLKRYLIEEEIEEYQENHISRREMVRRVLIMTGSVPTTASILLAAGCGASPTATVAPRAAPASARPSGAPSAAPASSAPSAAPSSAPATAARTATTAGATATAPAAATATRATTPAATATRTASATVTRTTSPTGAPSGVTVPPTDPAIEAGAVSFPGQAGTVLGYLSSPRAATKAPGLIVIHE